MRTEATMKCCSALAGSVALLITSSLFAANFVVSTTGNDANAGSESAPFATLERARDAVRQLKEAGPLPSGGVTIEIRAGRYELLRPIEFAEKDSGTADSPITYQARRGESVYLSGGRGVRGWTAVTDAAVTARLDAAARGHVQQADLKALGITDLQGINNAGVYQSDPGIELFFMNQPMTLARYPNTGYMHLAEVLDAQGTAAPERAATAEGRFICDDARIERWLQEKEVWLHGFWVWDWADQRKPLVSLDPAKRLVTLGRPAGGTIELRKGQWFYAENLLSELDSPGEWYIDREKAVLYFWPPGELRDGDAVLSMTRDLFQLNSVSHVRIRGVCVEAGRGTAFVVRGGSNVQIAAATIRNMGNWGAKVFGGKEHSVTGCDIYQTGQGGIHLDGGDRKSLVPGGHYADNNHIHHTSRWDPVYQQAIALIGVGNRATHNLIHHVPHIAIGFTGNEQTIEYNEIHHAVFQSNDAGAIYTSPPDETWSMRGHKIRFNYLHDIQGFQGKGCFGVYLDDCFSSADISSNIFHNVAAGILIGGGRDNLMTNNMFIKCKSAFSIDARGLGWASSVGQFATEELRSLNYKQPPWSVKYPELIGILEDEPLAPKGNVVARSICWDGPWGQTEAKAQPLVSFKDNLIDADPKLIDPAGGNFKLQKDSPAFKLGFQTIPFEKIGVYSSEDRASWPVQ